jgi:hypothetical protein
VWWRIGSSTTLGTSTSFIGNVISQNGVNAMQTVATLSGRFLGLSAATVTLDANTISAPICTVAAGGETRRDRKPQVSGLPNTGGAPIRDVQFPWSLVIVGGITAAALMLARRSSSRKSQSKK